MRGLRNVWMVGLFVALWSLAADGANLRGVITAIDGKNIELSLGSREGVKRGMVFLTRNRSGQVAHLEVISVKAHHAMARVLQKKGVISVGDLIELESKLFLTAEQIPPVPVSTAPSEPLLVKLSASAVNGATPPSDELRGLPTVAQTAPPKRPVKTEVDSSLVPDFPPGRRVETLSVTQRIAMVESGVVLVEVTTPNALHWTTGVVVSQDGYVMTSDEYVAFDSQVNVYVTNDKRYPARVMDKDRRTHLALLKLGVLTPEVTPIELQPMSGIEPGTRAMALGYHYPPLMVLQELPFKAATAWGAFGDLLARGEKGSVIEANLEPDVGFLGAPVFRMDTGQFAGLVSSIRTRSEDNARAAGVLTLHRSLTLLTPVDAIREFLKTNKVYPQPREDVAVIPEKTASLPLPPGDVLNLRLLPPNRELPSLFHQHYRMGLGSSYREDIVSDACYRFLGRVPSMVSEPLFDRDMLFFGSINGRFYAFDPLRGEANTFWANEGVAFLYAPAANREVVCASAGAVNLSPKARSTLLRQLTAMAARFATANVIAPQVAQVVPDIKDTGLLYAWDRATGDPKWVYPTRFLGPPKIVGNRVYFAGLGVLGALDVETGQEVWTPEKNGKNAKKDKDKGLVWYHIGHADEQNLFVMAIPVELCMEDQYQVCAAGAGDAQLQCLEPNTGKLKWQTKVASLEAAHTALSASLIYQPEDQSLWSLLGANVLTIDLTSQKKVRDYKKELPGSGKAASPTGMAYGNGILYLTSDQNFLYAVNAENGKEIWAKPFPARGKIGAPVVVKNRVYVGAADGYLYCLDAAQGSVVWKAKTGGTLLAKPVVTDDAIYCVSEEGDVHVIRVPDELNYQTAERKPSGELRRSGLELRK